ncbi:MAG: ABC transporter permease [Clostridia bacterium]|nr:ABC transporter permease [Clostridia bacterium]NLS86258.1 ABC transporter permease [Oscillospiraceae bacterium]
MSGILAAIPGAAAQGVIWGVMALGVYVTYRILDFADLTVDSSMATGAATSAMLIISGMNPLLTLVFAILAGMAAGLITGFLNTKLKIPAILAGILTQLGLYSINLRIMDGSPNVALLKQPVIISLGNIPGALITGAIFAAVVIAVLYWFFGTELGCAIRATGNNRKMVRAQGVNTDTTKIIALVISNGLVGLAGGLLAQYQGSANVNMSRGAIVIGLASVILGEVIFGARFSFAYQLGAVVCGSIIYQIVIAFVIQLGLSTNDMKLFSAITVAIALSVPTIKQNIAQRKPINVMDDVEPTDAPPVQEASADTAGKE